MRFLETGIQSFHVRLVLNDDKLLLAQFLTERFKLGVLVFQAFAHGLVDLNQISEFSPEVVVTVLKLHNLLHHVVNLFLLGYNFFE